MMGGVREECDGASASYPQEPACRPILFSGAMVRALLEGRKTQTRRALGSFDVFRLEDDSEAPVSCLHIQGEALPRVTIGRVITLKKLKAAVGDRLWVREAWCWAARGGYDARDDDGEIWYRATDEGECEGPWKPSIHMPRVCSRLTLTVTDVRVERLQDISIDDARAEGVFVPEAQYAQQGERAPVLAYAGLWDEINGAGAWETNPWVAAYAFTVEHRNIDAGRASLADAPKNQSEGSP